jgi:pimeloyl-ACP methyl ester carboxylesterase
LSTAREQPIQTQQRSGSRVWRWIKRGLLAALLVIAGLAIAGFIYQTISEASDRAAHPAPGQLVDIGDGRRLHLQCAGSGEPVVILDAGLGGFSSDWYWVQKEVAGVTHVCAYDRAGAGWSDPGPTPRDAAAITGDLHALLTAAGIEGPYVLAGHSFGGLGVRAYAAAFPDEVAGLVLVDSSHPEQWSRLPGGEDQFASVQWSYRIARAAVRLGLIRLTNFIAADPDLPPEVAQARKAMSDRVAFVDAAGEEFDASPALMAAVRSAGALGDKPLYVVTAGEQPPGDPAAGQAWMALQDELAALSTNSAHRTVASGSHMTLVTRRAEAAETAGAILAVVEAVRTGGRVAPR